MDIKYKVLGSDDLTRWYLYDSYKTYEEAEKAVEFRTHYQYYKIEKVWEYPF